MSTARTDVPNPVQRLLWGVAAGRCEFEGCNKPLYRHEVTDDPGNFSEKAHIHAVSPKGSRYDPELIDVNKFENLMLVCPMCHKVIDRDPYKYTADYLFEMKRKHEERIIIVTDIDANRKSTVLLYAANIAGNRQPISESKAKEALVQIGRYPTSNSPIDLSIARSFIDDNESEFYLENMRNLDRAFGRDVRRIVEEGSHVSVFAFAPMPLLMYLGSMLNDKYAIDVFQRQGRNVDSWEWEKEYMPVEFMAHKIGTTGKKVAVSIALSTDIEENGIYEVLGEDTVIYKLTISSPNRDFVTHPTVVNEFIKASRSLLGQIKHDYRQLTELHVFPAMPVSLAVRFGMDYMPKIDSSMLIYDYIKSTGFIYALKIGG